jgi:hypothetical protein
MNYLNAKQVQVLGAYESFLRNPAVWANWPLAASYVMDEAMRLIDPEQLAVLENEYRDV